MTSVVVWKQPLTCAFTPKTFDPGAAARPKRAKKQVSCLGGFLFFRYAGFWCFGVLRGGCDGGTVLYMALYKDLTVAFRLPRGLWERFKTMAAERNVSASRMLRSTMEAELARWETPARLRDRAKITEKEER